MLRQAILDDEVQVKTQHGVAFCQWRQLKEEHLDERATNAKLALEQKKVTRNQTAQLAMLFESVSMERPDPSAEELAAATASMPSSSASPQPDPPALQAIEDQKPEEPAVPERLNPKNWEQAEGLLKKAEAAVEKLKKERERERGRECVCGKCSRTRSVLYFVFNTSTVKDATKLNDKIKHNKDDPLTSKLPLGSFFLL